MIAFSKPTVGLALGSGMARGWAHIGVLRTLRAAGIEPDVVVGTSMGAVIGALHLAGKLDEAEAWARDLTSFGLVRHVDVALGGGGLVGGDKIVGVLRGVLGSMTFADLSKPFACVATDLITGHEVWLRKGPLVDALRASISLPGAFKPVKINNRWLVDGALVNPVPVSVCHAQGADVVIAVNVNADLVGRKASQMPGPERGRLANVLDEEQTAANGRIAHFVQQMLGSSSGAPTTFRVMAASLNILLDRIARSRLAGDPADVVIAPRVGHVGMMEFHRASEVIEAGRLATEHVLQRIGEAIEVFRTDSA